MLPKQNTFMRNLLLIIVFAFAVNAQAQEIKEDVAYKYIIVTMDKADKKDKIKVRVDDGIKNDKLKDDQGNTIVFNTKAGILMFFASKGWEFVNLYTSTQGVSANGYGSTSTSGMILFKKKVTVDEINKIVKQVIRD